INPGASTVVQADESNPFTINLQTGWNLIGNPYNFNVLWSDVLAANSALAGIAGVSQTLTTLSGSTLSNAATVLPKYRGAFVKAASAISLKIPVKYNSNAGRVASELKELASIDQPNWEVKLTLLQDGLRNEMAGIGMNTNASLKGKDKFDNERVPLPFDITELSSAHPEIVSALNKDVVPTQDNFTWTFDVKHAQQLGNVTLTWERSNINNPTKQLVLFDPATLHAVEMSTLSSYSITTATTQLQFIYGEKDFVQNVLDKELPLLGSPYPNPAKDEVTIPFRVSENDDQRQVQVKIYNAWGVEITTLLDRPMGKGSYEVSWQSQASPGLYFVKMQVANGQSGIVKLILK
ncbi:MAG: T9SS type A sorting domain-containing protein, partial [Flammeovirgaceae bacterium]